MSYASLALLGSREVIEKPNWKFATIVVLSEKSCHYNAFNPSPSGQWGNRANCYTTTPVPPVICSTL